MKRRLAALVAGLALLSLAWASIGEPKEVLLGALENEIEVLELEDARFEAESLLFVLEERSGLVYRVVGEATLDEVGSYALAALIGAATGYGEGIASPVRDFFDAQAEALANEGVRRLAVEEYLLELDVTGEAPYEVAFALELQLFPNDAFREARHALGPEDARFVVREFSDFQCPFCARFAQEALPFIKESLLARGDVRFEYHHFPLDSIHANARPAAEAAECVVEANDADSFWTYHDALFERLQAWRGLSDPTAYFVRLAEEVGLKSEGVRACIEARAFASEVEASFQQARMLGLRGTPTVFVNGLRMQNPFDFAEYERALELLEAFGE
jgi:protein-disulfide isomerase